MIIDGNPDEPRATSQELEVAVDHHRFAQEVRRINACRELVLSQTFSLRGLERLAGTGQGGKSERVLSVKGYRPCFVPVVYISPAGERISEQTVCFRSDNGSDWARFSDQPASDTRAAAINADLYRLARISREHAYGIDYREYSVPTILPGQTEPTVVIRLIANATQQ